MGVQRVKPFAGFQNFTGVNFDIRCGALIPGRRLVNHDFGVRQRETLVLVPSHQQERAHRRGHTDANSRDRRLHEHHRVVHRQTSGYRAARGVDVDANVFVRVHAFQKQELRANRSRHHVVYHAGNENNPLHQHPRVNVVDFFTAVGLLNHVRDWRVHCRLSRTRERSRVRASYDAKVGKRIVRKGHYQSSIGSNTATAATSRQPSKHSTIAAPCYTFERYGGFRVFPQPASLCASALGNHRLIKPCHRPGKIRVDHGQFADDLLAFFTLAINWVFRALWHTQHGRK